MQDAPARWSRQELHQLTTPVPPHDRATSSPTPLSTNAARQMWLAGLYHREDALDAMTSSYDLRAAPGSAGGTGGPSSSLPMARMTRS
jgi:hypothetical protein